MDIENFEKNLFELIQLKNHAIFERINIFVVSFFKEIDFQSMQILLRRCFENDPEVFINVQNFIQENGLVELLAEQTPIENLHEGKLIHLKKYLIELCIHNMSVKNSAQSVKNSAQLLKSVA